MSNLSIVIVAEVMGIDYHHNGDHGEMYCIDIETGEKFEATFKNVFDGNQGDLCNFRYDKFYDIVLINSEQSVDYNDHVTDDSWLDDDRIPF